MEPMCQTDMSPEQTTEQNGAGLVAMSTSITESSQQEVIGLLLQQNGSHLVTIAPQVSGVDSMATGTIATVAMPEQQFEQKGEPAQGELDSAQVGQAQGLTLVESTGGHQIMTLTEEQSIQGVRVTLPDGSTAILSQPTTKGEKVVETLQLEDGTTAIVQSIPEKAEPTALPKFVEGQAIQLEDGTVAYIQNTNKDGLQAVQLEDGTTAYIAHAGAEGIFTDTTQLDPNILSHFAQSTQNGLVNSPTRISSERALALGDKAYRCNYEGCGRLYTTQHHLKVHERSHTGDRPFKCKHPNCGKAFATGYGLKSHIRVHTGEKPYRCPEEACDKAFKTSGDLQKHVRTHTGERPFKCPFEGCERSFTTSNIRKVHIRTHTGERPYICEEEGCNKAFASATNYKNHIRIHTGEKPYVCTVQGCAKRFTEYSSLYKHHVVHTHSKPYVCNHCGKNYRQTSTLAMHKRTAHGEDVTTEGEAALLMQGTEENCLCLPSNGQGDGANKRIQLQFAPTVQAPQQATEEDEGTLIINTSDTQQVTMVTDNQGMAAFSQEAAQAALQQLTSGQGLTLADSDGQHVFVVTDPAQLEALQQLAQQQILSTVDSQSAEVGMQQDEGTENT